MPFFDFSVDNGGILSYFIPIKWQLFNKMPNYSIGSNGMNVSVVLDGFPCGEVFDKETFRRAVHAVEPQYSETAINWLLVSLRKKNVLSSAGAGKYYIVLDRSAQSSYVYPHSAEFLEVENCIVAKYPSVRFQMWELIQMNDFVSHQIAKNVIFVEVEGLLVDSVYDVLHERFPYAMNRPDLDLFYRQRAPATDIVVQRLVSEAPSPASNHSCVLEKILVDILSKKLSGQMIARSEYPSVFTQVFQKYAIDETRMFRYARRRHLYDDLRQFIAERTDIKLKTV